MPATLVETRDELNISGIVECLSAVPPKGLLCAYVPSEYLSAYMNQELAKSFFAPNTNKDGVYYDEKADSVILTGFLPAEEIHMPHMVNDKPIESIVGANHVATKVVYLPDTLKKLDGYFWFNPFVEKIVLGRAMQELGDVEFISAFNLKEVDRSKCIALKSIGQQAFDNTAIEETVIPNTVTTLGANLFKGCKTLQKVTIAGNFLPHGEAMLLDAVYSGRADDNVAYLNSTFFNLIVSSEDYAKMISSQVPFWSELSARKRLHKIA